MSLFAVVALVGLSLAVEKKILDAIRSGHIHRIARLRRAAPAVTIPPTTGSRVSQSGNSPVRLKAGDSGTVSCGPDWRTMTNPLTN